MMVTIADLAQMRRWRRSRILLGEDNRVDIEACELIVKKFDINAWPVSG